MKRVDHPFAHRHPNPVTLVFTNTAASATRTHISSARFTLSTWVSSVTSRCLVSAAIPGRESGYSSQKAFLSVTQRPKVSQWSVIRGGGPVPFRQQRRRSRRVSKRELVRSFDCVKKGITRSLSLTGLGLTGLSVGALRSLRIFNPMGTGQGSRSKKHGVAVLFIIFGIPALIFCCCGTPLPARKCFGVCSWRFFRRIPT